MNHQLKFKNMRTGDKVFDIVNYTLLTLIMVIVLYPVLYIVAASFSDPSRCQWRGFHPSGASDPSRI